MAVKLKKETQDLVDILLNDEDKAKRNQALAGIIASLDKDQGEKTKLESYLLDLLDKEKNKENSRWRRTWTVTALAALRLENGIKKVREHTTEDCESDPWVRHFALIYAANFDPFPVEEFQRAINDSQVLPKATALRLLLARGEDQYADELLKMLLDTTVPNARWAAARALRNRSEVMMEELRPRLEEQFIPHLGRIASDINTYLDTRWEAIQALASFKQKKAAATELAKLFIQEKDAAHRRYYLEALTQLNQPDESQQALLKAIEDLDAQVRLDAANALSKMIGPEKSIKLLLPLALEREKDTRFLVDALRYIDSDLAAQEIRDKLSNPDIKVSSKANQLLTMLGGQAAAQILMNERAKALSRYTDILSNADRDVRLHFRELMTQAKVSFWLSLAMHSIVFGIGVGALIASLWLAFRGGLREAAAWIGVGSVGGLSALAIIIATFYKNPLQNIRTSLNALMQIDVVFLGYVRQINQIDATFKHMFLDAKDFGTKQMKETVEEIQESMQKSLEQIQSHIAGK